MVAGALALLLLVGGGLAFALTSDSDEDSSTNPSGTITDAPTDLQTESSESQQCVDDIMTLLAQVPDAVSQGYHGVEINSLYVKYGASSPVVQIAQQEMGRLVGEIYSQGDPGKRIYEAQKRVESECAQAFP